MYDLILLFTELDPQVSIPPATIAPPIPVPALFAELQEAIAKNDPDAILKKKLQTEKATLRTARYRQKRYDAIANGDEKAFAQLVKIDDKQRDYEAEKRLILEKDVLKGDPIAISKKFNILQKMKEYKNKNITKLKANKQKRKAELRKAIAKIGPSAIQKELKTMKATFNTTTYRWKRFDAIRNGDEKAFDQLENIREKQRDYEAQKRLILEKDVVKGDPIAISEKFKLLQKVKESKKKYLTKLNDDAATGDEIAIKKLKDRKVIDNHNRAISREEKRRGWWVTDHMKSLETKIEKEFRQEVEKKRSSDITSFNWISGRVQYTGETSKKLLRVPELLRAWRKEKAKEYRFLGKDGLPELEKKFKEIKEKEKEEKRKMREFEKERKKFLQEKRNEELKKEEKKKEWKLTFKYLFCPKGNN